MKTRTAILLAFFAMAALVYFLRPGTLYLRIVDSPWTEVKVLSRGKPMAFRDGRRMRIWPLKTGAYTISVDFVDGKRLWMRYVHSDASSRKQVDLTVQRLDQKTARVMQVYNGAERIEELAAILPGGAPDPFPQ